MVASRLRRRAGGCTGDPSSPAISRNSARARPMAAATASTACSAQRRVRVGLLTTTRFLALSLPALLLPKRRSRARQRVPLGVNQALDLQRQLHVASAIEPLPGSALVGLQLRKLRLPKTQNVGFHAAQAGDIANLEVETIGNRRRLVGALAVKLRCHRSRRGDRICRGETLALHEV